MSKREKKISGDGLDKIIEKSEELDLSGNDIMRMMGGDTKILAYEQLENINDIDQILEPYGSAVILYETKQNFGHWVALIKQSANELEFFDPYGLKPDEELNIDNNYNMRIHGGHIVPHLSNLLNRSEYKVSYNNVRLQKFMDDVNTCGRHVIVRLRLKSVPMPQYISWMTNNKCYDADEWVSALTFLDTWSPT